MDYRRIDRLKKRPERGVFYFTAASVTGGGGNSTILRNSDFESVDISGAAHTCLVDA
jgi:hypothetical protein